MNAIDSSFVRPNEHVDSDHPDVISWATAHGRGDSPRAIAVSLYYATRDGFRYSPWNVRFSRDDLRASLTLLRGPKEGAHCIDKALLLAAAARVHGIPSRLHFANVRNHVGTARLEQELGTDILVFHGYCELYLGGRWVAATPAFNRELCERVGVAPLEFDGLSDSIFQAWDQQAGKFMEYVEDHGTHASIPYEAMMAQWKTHYPHIVERGAWPKPGDARSQE